MEGVAEMSAIGFGLDKTTFLDAGKYGSVVSFALHQKRAGVVVDF